MTVSDPLLELMASCVVQVERDGRFEGTGFFVAPGEVLTCAHVVHGGKLITVVLPDGTSCPAQQITSWLASEDPRAAFYPSLTLLCSASQVPPPNSRASCWRRRFPRWSWTGCS